MTNINVELKGPNGPQVKESLLPTAVTGYGRGLAVVYGSDAYHAALASVAGEDILGVIEEDAVSLQNPVSVILFGQAVVEIGAAVTAGEQLAVNASGQFIAAASGKTVVAKALEAGSNAGDYICALLLPAGVVHA